MSIEINHITKRYGEQLALNDVTLTINKGIVGLLGPNGAGKSTLMKIITCFIPPTSGTVSVEGHDVMGDPMAVKRIVGYLPEHNPLYLDMYVREYLSFVAGIHHITGSAAKQRIDQMIEEIKIETGTLVLLIDPRRSTQKRTQVVKVTSASGGASEAQVKRPVVKKGAKVGRNDPCPCGSGKKYKKCCGASEE